MNNEIIIPELNNETIESMIYVIRGVKVMLDFDLAKIYGYATRDFNNQVKNNIERFDADFRFQLSNDEWNYVLRLKKSTANNLSKTRSLPYAFTEQGIYMLMTVLKGELAVKQSKTIIRLFKQMKDYLVESNNLLSFDELLRTTNKNTKDIKEIKKKLEVVMDNFIDPSTYKHFAIYKGERIEAGIAYQTIYSLAKHSIYIIDDYIDIKTLQLLKCCNSNVKVIIFSDNKAKNGITKRFIEDFVSDTKMDIIIKENKISHDRFIAVDLDYESNHFFLCGSSSKDSGNKLTTIIELNDKYQYKAIFNNLLKNKEILLK
jgi:hypothetical protein